jgi:pyruvate formate lyase activating enzyme
MHPALLYAKRDDASIQCRLCAHRCVIANGRRGLCNVRINRDGVLCTLAYGNVVAAAADPIEKKPLYHFLPGSRSYSVATVGCNFKCSFCQNWQISQIGKEGIVYSGHAMSPIQIVSEAQAAACESISYTYTEPTIFFEYALDTAKAAKAAGLANCFVTNGYMTRDALECIQPFLDACNVDLKAYSNEFYQSFCKASLQPVLDSIRAMKELGIWVEVTTLLIPGRNDSNDELKSIAGFIADVDPDMPWHISRFRPDYQYQDSPATELSSLRRAREIGFSAGLSYVYLGNVLEGADTVCPGCQRVLIERMGYETRSLLETDCLCPNCEYHIAGIFSSQQ